MGGWWRLWVFVSGAAAALLLLMTWQTKDVVVAQDHLVSHQAAVDWANATVRQSGCESGSVTTEVTPDVPNGYIGSVYCKSFGGDLQKIEFAFAPAAFLLIVGMALGWVGRGFRRP